MTAREQRRIPIPVVTAGIWGNVLVYQIGDVREHL